MFRLGPTELIIILAIVILLFGAGRISKIAGELVPYK
jgi:TatA/E family protein of Tat protein translocase